MNNAFILVGQSLDDNGEFNSWSIDECQIQQLKFHSSKRHPTALMKMVSSINNEIIIIDKNGYHYILTLPELDDKLGVIKRFCKKTFETTKAIHCEFNNEEIKDDNDNVINVKGCNIISISPVKDFVERTFQFQIVIGLDNNKRPVNITPYLGYINTVFR